MVNPDRCKYCNQELMDDENEPKPEHSKCPLSSDGYHSFRASQILLLIGRIIGAFDLKEGAFGVSNIDKYRTPHRYLFEFKYRSPNGQFSDGNGNGPNTNLWLHEIYEICQALDKIGAKLLAIGSCGEERANRKWVHPGGCLQLFVGDSSGEPLSISEDQYQREMN